MILRILPNKEVDRRVVPMRDGFTLIELVVAISVTVMMLAIFLSFNGRTKQNVALLSERAKIAQIVLQAKSLSILAGNQEAAPPPYFCGYGVHFDYGEQKYGVFRYTTDTAAACKPDDIVNLEAAGTIELVDTYWLSVDAASVTMEGDGGGIIDVPIADILFIPPDPTTLIWTEDGSKSPTGGVVVRTNRGDTRAVVTVTDGGQVSY